MKASPANLHPAPFQARAAAAAQAKDGSYTVAATRRPPALHYLQANVWSLELVFGSEWSGWEGGLQWQLGHENNILIFTFEPNISSD
jgi:hypothetical protein